MKFSRCTVYVHTFKYIRMCHYMHCTYVHRHTALHKYATYTHTHIHTHTHTHMYAFVLTQHTLPSTAHLHCTYTHESERETQAIWSKRTLLPMSCYKLIHHKSNMIMCQPISVRYMTSTQIKLLHKLANMLQGLSQVLNVSDTTIQRGNTDWKQWKDWVDRKYGID